MNPGVYDMSAEAYHDDPVPGLSLSSSGARDMLPPSCPAIFRHHQVHARPDSDAFDFGRAAHRVALGEGDDLVVIDAADWRTKTAKAERDEARAAGKAPILTAEHDIVKAMTAALRTHPTVAALLDPATGRPEQTLIWQDGPTETMCRARLDWLPEPPPDGRLIVSDYKTCRSADPDSLSRDAHNYGYHQQADWYLTGVREVGYHPAPDFVFICQEKRAPYVVTLYQLDNTAMRIAAARNADARHLYRQCVDTGQWPAYVDGVHLLSLPPWAERDEALT